MATTSTVHIELGAAFWLLMAVIIGALILWSKLASEGMSKVIRVLSISEMGHF